MKRGLPIFTILLISALSLAEYIPFKVKLNALERIIVLSLLPKETNYANWKIINDLKNQLAFSEKELSKLELREDENGNAVANWPAVEEKEITFGEITEKIVMDALKKLDSEKRLLQEHLSVYEKFVVRGKQDGTP